MAAGARFFLCGEVQVGTMLPRHDRVRSALSLILIGAAALGAACGGGDTVDPGPAPAPPPPPPPANRAPATAATIPDQMVVEGQTVAIAISAAFSDPDGDTLTYVATTSNAGVVSVGFSGRTLTLAAVADGAATVTVRASDPGGLSASQSFAVEVAEPAPTTLTVMPDTATLTAIGRTVRLSADVRDQIGRPMPDAAVVWSSGDTAVATVDTSGLATAVANGSATVTALAAGASGEVSGSASIVVSQTAATVEIAPTTHTLAAGDTVRLVAAATDDNGHVVAGAAFGWTSSDTAVASVDSLGLVQGVAEGAATITAAAGDATARAEGTAEITVLPPPPPPDLTGTYFLASLVGTSTGGTRLTLPTVSGTLELAHSTTVLTDTGRGVAGFAATLFLCQITSAEFLPRIACPR